MTQPRTGEEKQILSAFLDQQLDVICWKLEGLTDDELRRPVMPTGMCLLAVAKHVAAAGCYWLCEIFGRPTGAWRLPASDDVELDLGDTTDGVLAFAARARTACSQAIGEIDLDATATTWLGDTVSFRWAILHTIEEAARHAGHADIIREHIENTTGYLPPGNLPY
jgi:hypothetical protein